LARAEQFISRRWRYEKLAPNSLDVADTLHNLGNVAYSRGDLARAEQYYQQALAIFEKLAPNSLQVAGTLNNLGLVALDRGDLAAAERYLQQALAIFEHLAPNSLQVATRSTIWGMWLILVVTWRVRSSCISRRWRFTKNLPPTR
jgi:Tfp pilus assembly protein PilF